MADPGELVLVSDRPPVTFAGAAGAGPVRRPGSVSEVLASAARGVGRPVTWVTPSTAAEDLRAGAAGTFDELAGQLGYAVDPVGVDPGTYRDYYEPAAARLLWMACHGLAREVPAQPRGPAERAFAGPYVQVNRLLAERAAARCGPDTPVLVQDYQLQLVPAALRAARPRQPVAFFLHTPFPDRDGWLGLPPAVRAAVLDGLLGADLLGFQRPRWAERFLRRCAAAGHRVDRAAGLVRHGGRRTWVRCYPVPVDPAEVLAAAPARTSGPTPVRQIVRVDRLDPAKNARRGFEAYGRLLDARPDLRGDVHFTACLVPSRRTMAEYRWHEERVLAAAAQVEARHPGSVTLHLGEDRARAFAALASYRVLLVNPLADGMNLVAQEGPLVNQADGVLVLSAGAGAADLLGGAAVPLADPTDVGATAAALARALDLPAAERAHRAARLRAAVLARRPVDWLTAQLQDLGEAASGRPPVTAPPADPG